MSSPNSRIASRKFTKSQNSKCICTENCISYSERPLVQIISSCGNCWHPDIVINWDLWTTILLLLLLLVVLLVSSVSSAASARRRRPTTPTDVVVLLRFHLLWVVLVPRRTRRRIVIVPSPSSSSSQSVPEKYSSRRRVVVVFKYYDHYLNCFWSTNSDPSVPGVKLAETAIANQADANTLNTSLDSERIHHDSVLQKRRGLYVTDISRNGNGNRYNRKIVLYILYFTDSSHIQQYCV